MASMLRQLRFVVWGNKQFTRGGYERAAQHFDNSCMQRSLKGRVVVVTGANAGLGFEVAKALAARGATLYMVCRSEQRGQAAVEAVRKASGNQDVHLAVCDVSSLASIAEFAAGWLEARRPLHTLINNAGVLLSQRTTTPEGYEASFATNCLGTAALTARLAPALAAAAPDARVIFVSSGGMYTQPLALDDMQHARGRWDGAAAYAVDKRRQVALAEHLAAAWAHKGIGVYAMHPGWADTEGVRTSIPGFHAAFKDKLRSPQQGADTVLWLALADAGALSPGAFFLDRRAQPRDMAMAGTRYSAADAAQLYDSLLALAGLRELQGQGAAPGAPGPAADSGGGAARQQ